MSIQKQLHDTFAGVGQHEWAPPKGMQGQPGQEIKPATELDNVFGEALRANGDLQRALDVLARRIEPVMEGEPEPEVAKGTPCPPSCMVVNMIRELANRDRFLTERVEKLIARIAI